MSQMENTPRPGPHDLFRISGEEVDRLAQGAPAWVGAALRTTPYVIVRREKMASGKVAVGVRGSSRAERFASYLDVCDDRDLITPELLVEAGAWRSPPHLGRVPALRALEAVAASLTLSGWRWGPGGSVGFELATGRPTATDASDLDIVIHCVERLGKRCAGEMMDELEKCGCGIDVILETPGGGVALRDWASSSCEVLLRTSGGATLVADPWDEAAEVPVCS